ncbi:universal stress protein [Enterococcus durans]|uniref:universal stress protein n=1 Tax=Enterococcus durans TaxID=53345 RepID=UPI0039A5C472
MKFSKIMVGVDETPDALKAFQHAIKKSIRDDAELIIISIIEDKNINVYQSLDKNYWQSELKKLQIRCKKYEEEAKEAGVNRVNLIIDEGDPGELIVNKWIPIMKPNLLVIGSKSTNKLENFFGSQASYMARYARISVMIVR